MIKHWSLLFAAPCVLTPDSVRPEVWRALQKKDDDQGKNLAEVEKAMVAIDLVDSQVIAIQIVHNFSCDLCRKIRSKLAQRGYRHLATLEVEKVNGSWIY